MKNFNLIFSIMMLVLAMNAFSQCANPSFEETTTSSGLYKCTGTIKELYQKGSTNTLVLVEKNKLGIYLT